MWAGYHDDLAASTMPAAPRACMKPAFLSRQRNQRFIVAIRLGNCRFTPHWQRANTCVAVKLSIKKTTEVEERERRLLATQQ
jgi:hypothetical protein